MQPRKAGGGLEGAACLRPHLPQYRAPFRAASCLWGIKAMWGLDNAFCHRAKQEATLKAPPANPLAAIQAPFPCASCLLVNKKNYLLQPRKAGGGLEGAACLRPHLPQYRAPFRLSPLVFWGIVAMWGFFWGQVAPSRAASCLLVNKKNYLLQPRKAGGGLEGAAC
ncbi:MAG: hypothetical protein IPP42_08365 [Saprospiraceae bacterium]|nr:hypothetical protein [Saprospiraceae bacterium]